MSDSHSDPQAPSPPTSDQLVQQVRAIIRQAQSDATVDQLSKRLVRDKLQSHFNVDLESRKKWLSKVIQDNVNDLLGAPASSRRSPATKRKRKPSPIKPLPSSASSKKSKVIFEDKDEDEAEAEAEQDEGDSDDNQAKEQNDAEAAQSTSKLSDFSELEDDQPARPRSASPSKAKKGKPRSSTASTLTTAKKGASGGSSGDAAAERLARLKSLVIAAGVRKPWKKLYAAANVAETDVEGKCTVVQHVVREIGITGRGSIAEAKRIRAEREFRDEVAALQENELSLDTGRSTRTSRGAGAGTGTVKKTPRQRRNNHDDDEGSEGDSEEDAGPKRKSWIPCRARA